MNFIELRKYLVVEEWQLDLLNLERFHTFSTQIFENPETAAAASQS
jgi:hypothetical protein